MIKLILKLNIIYIFQYLQNINTSIFMKRGLCTKILEIIINACYLLYNNMDLVPKLKMSN
jgi:hypothetical protein